VKVAVDARHLDGGRGVAEYTRGMLDALATEFPQDEVERKGQSPFFHRAQKRGLSPILRRVGNASAAILGWPRLGGGADVVWAPAPAPLAVAPDMPFVLTVHDLSWVERPGDFTPYERLWHAVGRLKRLALRADRLVVDAHATIAPLRRWGVDADRIRVVHPGVPRRPVGALPDRLPRGYVLYVGAFEPRKDPELLLEAHRRARRRGLDADLVFAGAGRLAPRLTGDGVHVIDPVGNGILGALYANARVLAMPSHLEGFGFPPLEAAQAGTPAIVSDLPVFRETLGDGAAFVSERDADAWAAAMLAPPPPPARTAFTWARAAHELRAVFAEVAR
jgi:glycosyltransferase involved in cell wall biosynthesis